MVIFYHKYIISPKPSLSTTSTQCRLTSIGTILGKKKFELHPKKFKVFYEIAAGLGIEPKFSPSKGDVLPLYDPAITYYSLCPTSNYTILVRTFSYINP